MTTVANIRTFRGDYRVAVLIDRTTPWGNPFRMAYIGDGKVSQRIKLHTAERERVVRDHLIWWYAPEQRGLRARAREELIDATILCHCWPMPCHGDTIANYLNHVVPFFREQAA